MPRVELHESVAGGVRQQLLGDVGCERAVVAHHRGAHTARADVDDEHLVVHALTAMKGDGTLIIERAEAGTAEKRRAKIDRAKARLHANIGTTLRKLAR